MQFQWPLMEDNITQEDTEALRQFLTGSPRLTQGVRVREFEEAWSRWLGVRYSVFVSSGSAANMISIAALRHIRGQGEVIVPTLTWVSDIAAVLWTGMKPVFVDINPRTLGMDEDAVLRNLGQDTKAVFLTHAQGFNAVSDRLLCELHERGIPLIEDVCESHGAEHKGRKCGTFGWMSNFSFYFAHHMSTIEGGMVCTDDPELRAVLRMMRSHGMVREADHATVMARYAEENPSLNPDFIFAFPALNVRNTEMGAILGLSQLGRLEANNNLRRRNLDIFLKYIDPRLYRTDFAVEGSCNYAFPLILRNASLQQRDDLETLMRTKGIEFRRGNAGGGNQLRQPYLRNIVEHGIWETFPAVEHVHFYGYYLGNYPTLSEERILALCEALNALP